MSPMVLAAYRQFAANDTGKLMRSGQNLVDRLRILQILESRRAQFPVCRALERLTYLGQRQERRFRQAGDLEAALANRAVWEAIGGRKFVVRERLTRWARSLVRRP